MILKLNPTSLSSLSRIAQSHSRSCLSDSRRSALFPPPCSSRTSLRRHYLGPPFTNFWSGHSAFDLCNRKKFGTRDHSFGFHPPDLQSVKIFLPQASFWKRRRKGSLGL